VEKTLRSGIFLECPNKKKAAEEEVAPKRRTAKGAAPAESAVVCSYSKRIGDASPLPTAETHGPVVEKESAKEVAKTAAKPAAKKAAKKGGKKALQTA
jgi:DNA topoisomerase-1